MIGGNVKSGAAIYGAVHWWGRSSLVGIIDLRVSSVMYKFQLVLLRMEIVLTVWEKGEFLSFQTKHCNV